jgi:hypothetical protein
MSGAIPPLPQYDFMAWCLVQHRDNFTFNFTLPLPFTNLIHLTVDSTLKEARKWWASVMGKQEFNLYSPFFSVN